jgi:cytochrome oxidase Cu insertion factor (SCO1/SenC/PrrC family)
VKDSSEPGMCRRGRRMLLTIAALFFVPLAIAFALYYGGAWRPGGTTNHGELITPARPLPAATVVLSDGSPAAPGLFHGKWSLVYIGAGPCAANCRQALVLMRQTRLALANDMTRVQRVFLATSPCCDREFLARDHPGLIAVDASRADGARLVQAFPAEATTDAIAIVDPLGNVMMRYGVRQDPKGLLQDLKHLLALSHIG